MTSQKVQTETQENKFSRFAVVTDITELVHLK